MSAPKAAPEWLPKRDAAAFLGISNRQLERRAYDGYIAKRFLERKPTDRSQTVVYKVEDLRALKDGAPNVTPVVRAAPKRKRRKREQSPLALVPAAPASYDAAPAPHADSLAALLAHLGAGQPPAPVKPWLTLKEAAEYSGLPASYLIALARKAVYRPDGRPDVAINVGTDRRASWRFSREGLAR